MSKSEGKEGTHGIAQEFAVTAIKLGDYEENEGQRDVLKEISVAP